MTETLQALHALHAEMRAQRLSQEHLTSSVLTALQRLKEPKKETLILGPGGFTYESEGYPFNALVVSDNLNGTDIEITERGQTYTYTLQAGWNVLNVSDGAYLTSATAISVMLVRDTRELFATFGTRVTVENASSNPVKTQLTGSKVLQNTNTYTLNIDANAQSQFQFLASAGKIARVNFIGVYVPGLTAATTGNQQIYITLGTATGYSDQRVYTATSPSATGSVDINSSNVTSAIPEIRFSDSIPLTVTIFNATDVAQTGTAMIQINYTEADLP